MSKHDTQAPQATRLALKDLAEASAQAVARAQDARRSAMVELTEEETQAVSGAILPDPTIGGAKLQLTSLVLRPPIVAGGIFVPTSAQLLY